MIQEITMESVELSAQFNTLHYSYHSYPVYLGPALRTSSLGRVNCLKFCLKRAARSAAVRSKSSLLVQVLRGTSKLDGTSGQLVGMRRPKTGSVVVSTLSSAPLMVARTIARV